MPDHLHQRIVRPATGPVREGRLRPGYGRLLLAGYTVDEILADIPHEDDPFWGERDYDEEGEDE